MPRRTSTRASTSLLSTPATPSPAPPVPSLPSNLIQLRQQWKWAAFCQFFFTFSPLFNMDHVAINDIERDLVDGTTIVLAPIMYRLLYTLTQDRKISLDNWQTSLRRQYLKRDPASNPLGVEPTPASRAVSSNPATRSQRTSIEPKIEENDIHHRAPSTSRATSQIPDADGLDDLMEDKDPDSQVRDKAADTSSVEDGETEQQQGIIDWRDLPMLAKLESMHCVAEWHFHNPLRLRRIMKDDDEAANWRADPIGYDANANAYWLIGDDRLWIQRSLSKPPQNTKRKRGTVSSHAKKASKRQKKKTEEREAPATSSRVVLAAPSTNDANSRGVRTAKLNANIKLDAQAKALAEYQRQAAAMNGRSPRNKASPAHPVGTRVSARLRGAVADEEEWQPVPAEWLAETTTAAPVKSALSKMKEAVKALPKTGLESDDDASELTDLSEDGSTKHAKVGSVKDDADETANLGPPDDLNSSVPNGHTPSHQDFIEWETICVTLHEWEHIAERFEKSTHRVEKALYKILAHTIIPIVTEQLREIERKRQREEANVNRKRSSRIAMKESEKEAARLVARQKAEEDEKLERGRRLEARLQREEEARLSKDHAREQRRKDREERERRVAERSRLAAEKEAQTSAATSNGVHANGIGGSSASGSGTRTPAGEDWELDCEICHRRGTNTDDGLPLMCCGVCSKWQHISCHDDADLKAGRPKRNWDTEEFVCARCRSEKSAGLSGLSAQHRHDDAKTSHNSGTSALPAPNVSGPALYSLNNYSHNRGSHFNGSREDSHPRPHAQPNFITFSHYQPHQRGFSTSGPFLPHSSAQAITGYVRPAAAVYQSSQQLGMQYPVPLNNGGGSSQFAQSSQERTTHPQQQLVYSRTNAHSNEGLQQTLQNTSINYSARRATTDAPRNYQDYGGRYGDALDWQISQNALTNPTQGQQIQPRYPQ